MSNDATRWKATRDKNGNLVWESVEAYDLDAALQQYDPTKRGRAFAVDNRIQEDKSITHVESEMLAGARNYINTYLQDWHIQCSGLILSELNEVGEGADSSQQFDKIMQEFEKAASKEGTDFTHEHEKTLDELGRKRKILKKFQRDNELDRDARYPESTTLIIGILFGILVIEAAGNAFFFSDNALGLLGGFFVAIAIAAVNVGICYLAGRFCLTQLNLKGWPIRKWAGLIGLVVSVAFVIALHLAVAHLREAMQHSADVEHLVSLAFDPRTLEDTKSLALIGLGLIAGVIALLEGYKYDDPYPGYGDVYRDWKNLDDAVHEQMKGYKHAVNDAYNRAVAAIGEIPNSYAATEKSLQKVAGEIDTYFACVERYYDQAKGVAHALITTFRKEVEAIWESPGSFPVSDNLVRTALPVLDPSDLKNEVEKRLEALYGSLRNSRAAYKEEKAKYKKALEDKREKWIGTTNLEEMVDDMMRRIKAGADADRDDRQNASGVSRGGSPMTADVTGGGG